MAVRPTILIAACDAYLALVYGRQFEREGWSVTVVDSVAEAERRAVRIRPSVLLFEAACVVDAAAEVRRLKALPTLLKSHIVVLSDGAHMHAIRDVLAAGASDYLLAGHVLPIEAAAKMKRLAGV